MTCIPDETNICMKSKTIVTDNPETYQTDKTGKHSRNIPMKADRKYTLTG